MSVGSNYFISDDLFKTEEMTDEEWSQISSSQSDYFPSQDSNMTDDSEEVHYNPSFF